MGSFFSKLKSAFAKLFGGTGVVITDLHIAAGALQLCLPPLVLVLQQAGKGEAATEVSNVANEITTDSGVLSTLFTQAQSGSTTAGSQITNVLTGIQSNVGALLSAGHIKDASTVTLVTNAFNAFVTEAKTVIGLFPAA